MMRFLATLKDRAIKIYDAIVELEKMPLRGLQGEFYEEKEDRKKEKLAPRKNKVRVEDLRPQKHSVETTES